MTTTLPHHLPTQLVSGAFARSVEGWAAMFTGDLRRARWLGREAVRIAEPLGDHFAVGTTATNLAWVLGLTGELDEARALMAAVVGVVEDAGPDADVVGMGVVLGKLHLWSGDFDGAVEWFERCAARFAEPAVDGWIAARALPGLASALRRLGRPGEAREYAGRAVALARQLDVPHVLAEALEESAFLVAPADPAAAADLHHRALAVRVGRGLRTFYVDSLEALAGLAVAAGSPAEAVRLLAACETGRERIGYPRPAINQPDHETAVAAARAALGGGRFADAWSRGAALTLDDAVGYATRARGARGRPATGWASLTPTEREVVGLVVECLTNPQIGARLFMSRATVKTHLSHVYAKLGLANRIELATLAHSRHAADQR